MITLYLSYFTLFLIVIVILFALGFLVASLFQRKIITLDSFYVLSWIYIIGLLALIFLISVWQTHGKTSYLLILPSLLFFQKLKKLEITFPRDRLTFSHIALCIFWIFIVFGFSFFSMWNFQLAEFNPVSEDNVFYAQIAKVLIHSTEENTYSTYNILINDFKGVSPYHYADIWMTNAIIRFSDIPPGHVISMIVYPVFGLGWIMILTAFTEHFNVQRNALRIGLVLVVILIGGLWIGLYDKIYFLRMITVFNAYPLSILGEKATIIYVLLGFGILEYYKKNHHVSLFLLSVVCVIYPLFVPSGILIFILNLGYGWVKQNVFRMKQGLLGISIIGFYLGFYWLFDNRRGQCLDLNFSFSEEILKFSNPAYIKIAFNVFLGGWIQIFGSFFWYLPFVFWGYNLGFKKIICRAGIIIGISLLAGLTVWSVLFNIIDMVQLVSGAGVILLNVFLCFLFIGIFSHINSIKAKAMWILGAFLVIVLQVGAHNFKYFQIQDSYYSKEYQRTVLQLPTTSSKTIIAIQRNDFGGILDLLSSHRILASFILSQKKNTFQVSLDDFNVPSFKPEFYHEKVAETIKKTGIFYQFYQSKKELNPAITVPQARLLFLDEHKINIFICDKNTIVSDGFKQKFNLLATDSASGERCYVRKN